MERMASAEAPCVRLASFRQSIPRQQLIYPALLVAVYDGGERRGQVGLRIDGIELACLHERSDGRPVLRTSIMTCEKCVLPIERNRSDGPLDTVIVDLNAAVSQEELQTIPVFGNIGQWGSTPPPEFTRAGRAK